MNMGLLVHIPPAQSIAGGTVHPSQRRHHLQKLWRALGGLVLSTLHRLRAQLKTGSRN